MGESPFRDTLSCSGSAHAFDPSCSQWCQEAPFYHIVVSENDRIPTGRAVEVLGFVNPIAGSGEAVRIDVEKAKSWLQKGAQPSKTVLDLFKKNQIL
ncbi:MAG TPA: 30S ribosomal protein S16 [Geothrix sp.]